MKYSNEELESLAKYIKEKMILNKCLHYKLEKYKYYNTLSKEIITKCVLNKNIPPISLFKEYNEIIKKNYDKIKTEYDNIYSKQNSLFEKSQITYGFSETDLSKKENEQFILDNLNIKKNSIIKSLKRSIKLSKFSLVKEKRRDNLISIRRGNIESEKLINDYQQNMLYECKKCNKYKNEIQKNENKIKVLNNNIKLLEKYIKENNLNLWNSDKILISKTYDQPNENSKFSNNNKIYKNDFKNDIIIKFKHKSSNKIISEFIKKEQFFNLSGEEGEDEKIIDEELHSDEENNFEEKIKQKNKLSINHIKEIKKTIPKIDFNVINFNKLPINNEIDVYSLERRIYKNKNIDKQLKYMKRKIERIKNKLNLFKKKESSMKNYVKKLEEKYNELKPMIYMNTVDNIQTNDFITKSLRQSSNIKKIDKKDEQPSNDYTYISFILEEDNISNLYSNNEKFYNDNEKTDNDKKETKDTKNCDIEEKKISKKLVKFSKKTCGKIKRINSITIRPNNKLKDPFPIIVLKKNNAISILVRSKSK